MEAFEPKIIAFLCNWCAYAAADLAGVSRFQYPSSIRPVRVMCSARVDPIFIVKALKEGWDGILVSGWHIGDCHYQDGNVQAEKKIQLTQKLLELAGIGRERLHLAWCSSAEGQRFADIVQDVTEAIKEQGPFDPALFELQLGAAERTAESERLRWLMSKAVPLIAKGDVYGRRWDEERIAPILNSVLEREYHQNLIYLALKQGHTSVRDISKHTGLDLLRISQLLSELEKASQVVFKGHQNRAPRFEAA